MRASAGHEDPPRPQISLPAPSPAAPPAAAVMKSRLRTNPPLSIGLERVPTFNIYESSEGMK